MSQRISILYLRTGSPDVSSSDSTVQKSTDRAGSTHTRRVRWTWMALKRRSPGFGPCIGTRTWTATWRSVVRRITVHKRTLWILGLVLRYCLIFNNWNRDKQLMFLLIVSVRQDAFFSPGLFVQCWMSQILDLSVFVNRTKVLFMLELLSFNFSPIDEWEIKSVRNCINLVFLLLTSEGQIIQQLNYINAVSNKVVLWWL